MGTSSTSYQGRVGGAGGMAGAGGGGKIRKKTYRSTKAAPYDRPLTAVRNCNNSSGNSNGWLSKLVDPASRLISSSARKLLSSVFQKRILPLAGPKQDASSDRVLQTKLQDSSDMVHSATENKLEDVAHNPVDINFDEVAELEQMLKQNTFTRYEIDRLTVLLRSRYVGGAIRDEEVSEGTSDKVVSEHVLGEHAYTYTPQRNNMPLAHKFIGISPSPTARYEVFDEDITSPSELAKAYMSSRSSKFSPKMSAFRGQVPSYRVSATPNALMSNTQSTHFDNGFTTPGSRSRPATNNIGNSPYSDPSTSLKGTELRRSTSGESSSPANKLFFDQHHQHTISGSTDMSLKRRSSVLQDHFGSVGSIRRVRQKLNLLSSKGVDKPAFGSPISITEPQGQMEALTDAPTSIVGPAPAQSIEPAQRTAPQLDKLITSQNEESSDRILVSPIEKSSPHSGCINQKYEKGESSKVHDIAQDDNKVDDSLGTSKLDTGFSGFEYGKPRTNKHTKLNSHSTAIQADTEFLKDTAQADKETSRDKISVLGPLQKKQAFRMSVFEDFVDMDEDIDGGDINVSVSGTSNGETLPSDGGRTISSGVGKVENPSVFLPSGSSNAGVVTGLATSEEAVNSIKNITVTSSVEIQSVTNQYAVQDIPSKLSTKVPVKGQDIALPVSSSSLEVPDRVSTFRFSSSPSVGASAGVSASNIYAPGFGDGSVGSYRIPEPNKGDDVRKDQNLYLKPPPDDFTAAPISTTSGSLTLGPAVDNKSDLSNGSSFLGSSFSSMPPATFIGDANQNATNSTIVGNHKAIDGISSIASLPTQPSLDLRSSGAKLKQEVSSTPDSASEAKTSPEPTWGNSSDNPLNRTTSAIAKIETPMFGFSTYVASTIPNSQHQSSAAGGDGSGVIGFQGSVDKSEVATGTYVQSSSTSPAPISDSSAVMYGTVASSMNSSAPSTQLFPTWTSSSSAGSFPAVSSTPAAATATSTGVMFAASSAPTATTSTGLAIGTSTSSPSTTTPSAGFPFGASSTPVAATASPGLIYGASSTSASITPSAGFSFGASTTPAAADINPLGTLSTPGVTATSRGFPFGASSNMPATGTSSGTGFPFGASSTPTATATNPFGASSIPAAAAANPFGASLTLAATGTNPFGASSTLAATAANPFGTSSTTAATSANPFGASSTTAATAANPFGTPSTLAATAANPFGASSTPAASTTSNGSPFGASSTPAASTTSTGSPFGASSTPAASNTSAGFLFGASTTQAATATNLFGPSSTPAAASTGTGFLFQASSSTPATAAGFPFGTSSTPATTASTSSGFNFGSSSTPPGFSFNASSVPAATNTASPFGFTASTFNNTPSAQPVFGNSNPFGSIPAPNNNTQTGMEVSMAEDSMQASQPSFSMFGQQQTPNASSFGFSAPAPASAFQGSGSLGGFNAGGSFSLGSGGGDKSNRRIVKPKKGRKK